MRTVPMQLNELSYCRERVFPEDCSQYGGSRPYDTILKGVKVLAKWLYENNCKTGDKKVNLNNKLPAATNLLNIDMGV